MLAAGPGQGLAARLPAVQARKFAARDVRRPRRWGKRGARVNTISPGIIITPLAKDELNGPRGAGYRRMIDGCPAKRAGTPDEVATVAALLMGADGAFITGSDKSRLGMPGCLPTCDARGGDLQLKQLRHALVASADRRPRPPLPAPGARLGPAPDEGYARRLGE